MSWSLVHPIVHGTQGGGGTGPTGTMTSTTAGNLLVAVVGGSAVGSAAASFTMPSGWTLVNSGTLAAQINSSTKAFVGFAYYWNNPGGITSVQATWDANGGNMSGYIDLYELSGELTGSDPFDTTAGIVSTGANGAATTLTASLTPTSPGSIVIAAFTATQSSLNDWGTDTGWTQDDVYHFSGWNTAVAVQHIVDAGTTTESPSINTPTGSVASVLGIIAFQGPVTSLTVDPTGIASGEAFGTLQASRSVEPVGIASGEAFGTVSARPEQTAAPTGIASGEAFGSVLMQNNLRRVTGIASGEAFGTTKLSRNVTLTGIASSAAMGNTTVPQHPVGIPSGEAIGNFHFNLMVGGKYEFQPYGIHSGEAFGTVFVSPHYARPIGIPSGEAFGNVSTNIELSGNFYTQPPGIPSEEAFGPTTVVTIQPEMLHEVVGVSAEDAPTFTLVFTEPNSDVPVPSTPGTTLVVGVSYGHDDGTEIAWPVVADDGWVPVGPVVRNATSGLYSQMFAYPNNPGNITQVSFAIKVSDILFSDVGWSNGMVLTADFAQGWQVGHKANVTPGTNAVAIGGDALGTVYVFELTNGDTFTSGGIHDDNPDHAVAAFGGFAPTAYSEASVAPSGVGTLKPYFVWLGEALNSTTSAPVMGGSPRQCLDTDFCHENNCSPIECRLGLWVTQQLGLSFHPLSVAASYGLNAQSNTLGAKPAVIPGTQPAGYQATSFAVTNSSDDQSIYVDVRQIKTIPGDSVMQAAPGVLIHGMVLLDKPTLPGSMLLVVYPGTGGGDDAPPASAVGPDDPIGWVATYQEWALIEPVTGVNPVETSAFTTTNLAHSIDASVITGHNQELVLSYLTVADASATDPIVTPDGYDGGVLTLPSHSTTIITGGMYSRLYGPAGSVARPTAAQATTAPMNEITAALTTHYSLAGNTDQFVSFNGIPSGEAFGAGGQVIKPPLQIHPFGIATSEAMGSLQYIGGGFDLANHGIPSGEAFGQVSIHPIWTYPRGIPSDEAFGLLSVQGSRRLIDPAGIPSGEVVSAGHVGNPVHPFGIASTEVVGQVAILRHHLTGIPSHEAFGFPTVFRKQTIHPTGIPSGEAFGALAVYRNAIRLTGIASGEAFGDLDLLLQPHGTTNRTFQPYGIPSGEAFGGLKLSQAIHPFGWHDNGTGFQPSPNSPLLNFDAFGRPVVSNKRDQIGLGGIPSGEAFGKVFAFDKGSVLNPPTVGSAPGPTILARGTPDYGIDFSGRYPDGLTNAYDVWWNRTAAASENTIEFTLPANDPAVAGLTSGATVNVPYIATQAGQDGNFKIMDIALKRDGEGLIQATFTAEANHYALGKIAATPFKSDYGTLPFNVLSCALAGTGWSVGTIDPLVNWSDLGSGDPGGSTHSSESGANVVGGTYDSDEANRLCAPQVGPNFSSTRASVLTMILQVAQTWGGYIKFDEAANTVSLVSVWGGHTGLVADWQKNLQACERHVTDKPQQEILIVENQNGAMTGLSAVMMLEELLIADACDQQVFEFNKSLLPNPCAWSGGGATVTVKTNQMEMFREQIYEQFLLNQGPRTSYAATVINLEGIDPFAKGVHLGDWITIKDDELGINDSVQTVGEKYNILEPFKSTYQFSNEVPFHTNTIGIMPAKAPPIISASQQQTDCGSGDCATPYSGSNSGKQARSDIGSILNGIG